MADDGLRWWQTFLACGFCNHQKDVGIWSLAEPELFLHVPSLPDDILAEIRRPGGSPEDKIKKALECFRTSALRFEAMQHVLRRPDQQNGGPSPPQVSSLPDEVVEVVARGTYTDSFLAAYDGRVFPISSKELVPGHEYRLSLEVHGGGKYWVSVLSPGETARHQAQTLGLAQSGDSETAEGLFGSAQRGAVFAWRWQHVPDRGPYGLPSWMSAALAAEGKDPLQKLERCLAALHRWELDVRKDVVDYFKNCSDVKNAYIREVLRLWPAEKDSTGAEVLKKCAWVQGLDPSIFMNQTVLVRHFRYDSHHKLGLYATISRRHQDAVLSKADPPYRLKVLWRWEAMVELKPQHDDSDEDEFPGSRAVEDAVALV